MGSPFSSTTLPVIGCITPFLSSFVRLLEAGACLSCFFTIDITLPFTLCVNPKGSKTCCNTCINACPLDDTFTFVAGFNIHKSVVSLTLDLFKELTKGVVLYTYIHLFCLCITYHWGKKTKRNKIGAWL